MLSISVAVEKSVNKELLIELGRTYEYCASTTVRDDEMWDAAGNVKIVKTAYTHFNLDSAHRIEVVWDGEKEPTIMWKVFDGLSWVLHRDGDLPAYIKYKTQRWYQNGKLSRNDDLPAIVEAGTYVRNSVDRAQKLVCYVESMSWYINGYKRRADPTALAEIRNEYVVQAIPVM